MTWETTRNTLALIGAVYAVLLIGGILMAVFIPPIGGVKR